MCVNDLIVQGAEPLFFLDYFATGRLSVETGREIISGIAAGCRDAGCALVGGETAEMPGMYADGDYDLAGFAVGAVEREQLITGERVAPGDRLLGLASSGLHSNGFSLVRKILADTSSNLDASAPFDSRRSLAEALLEPTRIYVKGCLEAFAAGEIHALAHITGGGLIENLPRVLPSETRAIIDLAAWSPPPVFNWLAHCGDIAEEEMLRTFNCGIGMVLVVPAADEGRISAALKDAGETVFPIGSIDRCAGAEPAVEFTGRRPSWLG